MKQGLSIADQVIKDLAEIAMHVGVPIVENWVLICTLLVGLIITLGFPKKDDSSFLKNLRYGVFQLLLILVGVVAISSAVFTASIKQNVMLGVKHTLTSLAVKSLWLMPITILIIGAKFLFLRRVSPWLSQLKKDMTRGQKKDSLSDIREVKKEVSATIKSLDFDPRDYYRDGEILFGLDAQKAPILVPFSVFRGTHKQYIGKTGDGKGTLIGCLADQIVKHGCGYWYFDPKNDRFIPHILFQRCQAMGRRFVYLSLHNDEPGFWGPFLGGNVDESLARLIDIFKLKDTDKDSDFHKKRQQRLVTAAFDNGIRDLQSLYQYCQKNGEEESVTSRLSVWSRYRSLLAKPGEGFSVYEAIKNADVVYVKGDLRDPVMLGCFQLLMIEISQESTRLKDVQKPHIFTDFDEVSFYISENVAGNLSTIRDNGISMGLAYQSRMDIERLEDQSKAAAVANSVDTNCAVKLIYGGWDEPTSKWVAELSGTIYKEAAMQTQVESNAAAAEVWGEKSSVTLVKEHYIPQNLVKLLPPRVGVLFRPTVLPEVCYTSFVPVADMSALKAHITSLPLPPDPKAQAKPTKEAGKSDPIYAEALSTFPN